MLLHDPYCLFKFDDNNLVIPIEALEELDAIKMEQSSERGRNARRVHRLLRELLPDSRAMLEGVPLDSGGTLSVVINKYLQGTAKESERLEYVRSILNLKNKDNRIIATALFLQENYPPPVILVTKDVNMQLKARAVGSKLKTTSTIKPRRSRITRAIGNWSFQSTICSDSRRKVNSNWMIA